jgi:hypothetical protein
MNELNLQNRFDIVFEENSYTFTTETGISYHVAFIDYSIILDVDFPVYMLSIERDVLPTKGMSKFDCRTQNTILYILNEFFSHNQNAIISIYDSMDGRQESRRRLFNRWYNEYNSIGLVKIERDVKTGDYLTTATLLYSSSNKKEKNLIACFDKIVNENFYC